MNKIEGITMTKIDRLAVISKLVAGEITTQIASIRLRISTRQVRRLAARFGTSGAAGLMSLQQGKSSNRQLAPGMAQTALETIREHYSDFGPTLAREKLHERHDLLLAVETVRKLMIQDGLWKTRQQCQTRIHQPRTRRECFGDLVQIDGSLHRWFEERGQPCTLLVFVDDATGLLMHIHFARTESALSYFAATHCYVSKHGKPQTFYSDRAGVFKALRRGAEETRTQFHRALTELNIDLIFASSAEAKGRVERMNRSLQDRLVKELRLAEISTIEEANAWSWRFVKDYNDRCGQRPSSELNLHRKVAKDEQLDLILAWREVRKLTAKLTVQNGDWIYVLKDTPTTRKLVGHQISIHIQPDEKVQLTGDGKTLEYVRQPVVRRAKPIILVDSKTLDDTLLQLRQPRVRGYKPSTKQKQADLAQAKKLSAEKRRSRPPSKAGQKTA
jgi:hypothetical protein